jgi:hypothetical protein
MLPSFKTSLAFSLGACVGGAIIFAIATYRTPEQIALDNCAKSHGVYSCVKVYQPNQKEPEPAPVVVAKTELLKPPFVESGE